jgi:subtilisin family serine protease
MTNGTGRFEPPTDAPRVPLGPQLTGRYLVVFRAAGDAGIPKALRDKAGLTMASSSDFDRAAITAAKLGGADGVYLERLGIAITSAPPQQLAPLTAAPGGAGIIAVEPEHYVYLFADPRPQYSVPSGEPLSLPAVALQGYEGGALVCAAGAPRALLDEAPSDESAATWGLTATRVLESRLTGRGVRVAVLDTGFDANHPDFAGRTITRNSFVSETADDGHGHGTHCSGTALGAVRPEGSPRYGVAPGAEIFIGKVMADTGRGQESIVLAGIEWAVANGCRVVSMSLGYAVPMRQSWEITGRRALDANTLLVAAAGNESQRPDVISPVGCPANCPSIMAVGAVDSSMRIAAFSTRGTGTDGGAIDIVAPGVDVYSSAPLPARYKRMSGTSMACPHVAGIAALYAEAYPSKTAREIWQLLAGSARKLDLDAADGGAGLVQAPV